jgi:polysaccharide biosynthesis protein PslH
MSLGSLGHCDLRQAPPGDRIPPLVVDSHEIAYDLARQFARTARGLGRRLYAGANWRKLRREELGTYRAADGVYLCSAADCSTKCRTSTPAMAIPSPSGGRSG